MCCAPLCMLHSRTSNRSRCSWRMRTITARSRWIITAAIVIRTWSGMKASRIYWMRSSGRWRRNEKENSEDAADLSGDGFHSTARDRGGPLEFLPGKGLAVDGPFYCPDQHRGKELAISKTLRPHVQKQRQVFSSPALAPLEQKGQRRGEEINGQKHREEKRPPLKTAAIRAFRVKVPREQILSGTEYEQRIN